MFFINEVVKKLLRDPNVVKDSCIRVSLPCEVRGIVIFYRGIDVDEVESL